MTSIPVDTSDSALLDQPHRIGAGSVSVHSLLRPLASLKLTVTLFALAIVVILVGTLAQVEMDIWQVLEDYFKPWVTWVDVPLLFPRSWFPLRNDDSMIRAFAWATIGISLLCGTMIMANAFVPRSSSESQRSSAYLRAGLVVFLGGAISISTLLARGFWLPGGAMIGAVMCINLLAAHVLRFKVHARGRRLGIGLGLLACGVLLTWLVIASGHNPDGFQGQPPFAWRTLWLWVKIGLSVVAGGLLLYVFLARPATDAQRHVRWICAALGASLTVLAFWLWATRDNTYLGDSGMRVLWQLILGLMASVVLLMGAIPLFGRRAGIVVLHGGVGLLMFGQWFVSSYDVEEQMTMAEGDTVNYGQDIRSMELAVIERQSAEFNGQDDVVVIPLTRNGKPTRFLRDGQVVDERLPFRIEVVDYMGNSRVEMLAGGEATPADSGNGLRFQAVPLRGASGASSSAVDLASGYFRFVDAESGESLGTFLLSQDQLAMRNGEAIRFDTQPIRVGDDSFDVQLRFVRNYKDYSMQLVDVRKDDYLGTTIPRNYSSEVVLKDAESGIEHDLKIWMNNPRRYAGETFYQSGWQRDPSTGTEYSTLQVVRNHGWMIPYVACMVCMVGMLAHFSLILLRFLNRHSRTAVVEESESVTRAAKKKRRAFRGRDPESHRSWADWLVPVGVLAASLLLLARVASPPKSAEGEMQLEQFGALPLVYQGRVKPFDTLARNSLARISDAQSFTGVLPLTEYQSQWPEIEKKLKEQFPAVAQEDLKPFQNGDFLGLVQFMKQKAQADPFQVEEAVKKLTCRRQPATRWLLDVVTGSVHSRRHRVFRIYNPEVRDLFGLERRPGFRYSLEELTPKMDEFERQARIADQLKRENVEQLSLYQRKLLDLDQRLRTMVLLYRAFRPPDLPPLPTPTEFQNEHDVAMEKLNAYREAVTRQTQILQEMSLPLSVPPEESDGSWQAYSVAWPAQFLANRVLGEQPSPAFGSLNEILVSYLNQDVEEFNSAVAGYHGFLEQNPPSELSAGDSYTGSFVSRLFGSFYRFEAYFNHAAPFWWSWILYIVAFALLALSWLCWRQPLQRAAFWLIVLTFVLHTFALIARIYISGRPPVTNLYSSAVFIGWGVVGLALVIELFFKNGLASVIAAGSGIATLFIAHKLALEGDTFQVLQAVLDTQFWLATHVVCITFGYATTFLAGGLGLLFILRGVFTPSLSARTAQELGRMIYGTLCFAILFSFIGTILGGLWADDSWGRFWGWDPKENGALIIVLWNALILHARWDGMIRERGMAILSVMGNVVTAWSWFGVNELGVGLHSYGFTEGRLLTLAVVILAHLLAVWVGWLPTSLWWSFLRRDDTQSSRSGPAVAGDT